MPRSTTYQTGITAFHASQNQTATSGWLRQHQMELKIYVSRSIDHSLFCFTADTRGLFCWKTHTAPIGNVHVESHESRFCLDKRTVFNISSAETKCLFYQYCCCAVSQNSDVIKLWHFCQRRKERKKEKNVHAWTLSSSMKLQSM